jgi:hypothetical protein
MKIPIFSHVIIMSEANEIKVLRQIVGKTRIHRIRSQQIRESYGIKPINDLVERRRRRRR